MRFTHLGGLAIAFTVACRTVPQMPVQLQGDPLSIAWLAGSWTGEYWGGAGGRGGSLSFTLRSGTDSLYGDVTMVDPHGQQLHAADAMDVHARHVRSPQQLRIDVVRADATRAFRYMKSGGVSVLPLDVSYAIFAATARGVERIFELKNRKPTKPNGIVGNWDIFSDVLKTQPRDKDLVRCLTQDHDLPLSVIAPFTIEHDWLRSVEFGALRRATKEGTMDLLLNAGALHNELARMSWESATPLMGSSANVSLAGSKFRLEDVEDSVKQGSDFVLGYGTSKYINDYGIGSTIIELPTWKVLRWGGLFEKQAEIVKKQFKVELDPRPKEGPITLT